MGVLVLGGIQSARYPFPSGTDIGHPLVASGITTDFLVLQLSLLGGLFFSLGFLYYCLQYRQKRGVTSLVVMFTGIAIWIGSELVQIQLRDPSFAGLGMALRILGIEITVIGMLFLGLEYTARERLLTWKLAAVLSVVPLLEIGLALSPSRELLFEVQPAEGAPWGYELVATPLFLAHTVYSYLFVVASLGLIAAMMLRANVGYRRQLAAVFVSILFPALVNASFHLGFLPFDLTPVSFVGTAAVLMFATFRLRLLDAIPVARQTVLEEMEDMVVVLDEDNDIITTNSAVTETFDVEGSLVGEPGSRLFGADGLDRIISAEGQQQLELVIDGERRSINVNSSQITDYRDNLLARVLVCRDVTEQQRQEEQLRRREQELELLKDLQSRFLRHNLRNELNVVRANAELLADLDDPVQRDRYETIIEKTERILDWSTKARAIERLVETSELVVRDVTAEIDTILGELREEYPDVVFEFDADDVHQIRAVPQFDRALWNVLDNAARYNTADDPRVEVTVEREDDCILVRISDNGPGIESYEIETLEDQEETQLQHGTGLGLWLVYWVMDKSNGNLSFAVDDGTTVTLEFDAASDERAQGTAEAQLTADGGVSQRSDLPE